MKVICDPGILRYRSATLCYGEKKSPEKKTSTLLLQLIHLEKCASGNLSLI